MKYRIRGLVGLLVLSLLTTIAFAQVNNQEDVFNTPNNETREVFKNWYVGMNAGGTVMLAYLREKPIGWAIGAIAGRQFNRKIGIQTNFLIGKLRSEDAIQNYLTKVNFFDASLILKMNLNDIIFTRSPKVLREFYLLGGGGLTFYNSKVTDLTTSAFLTGVGWDATGSVKTGNVMNTFIPVGLGLSFDLTKSGKYYLTTEFTYRFSKDNQLDGGYSASIGAPHPAHYIYTSVGFVYNIGKTSVSTQQITSEAIEKRVKSAVIEQVKYEMVANIQEEIKPFKDKLANQSKTLADNKRRIADVDMRINALNESFKRGVVTSQLPDGSFQTTSINGMAAGAVPFLTSIYFAFNSLYITPDMQREIAVIAKVMKKNRKLKCEITGNASKVGGPAYNLMLSEKRSQAVARFLISEFGIRSNRLILKSNGLSDPLAKNLHKINRRVDMQLFW